jgi:hypothetical protein
VTVAGGTDEEAGAPLLVVSADAAVEESSLVVEPDDEAGEATAAWPGDAVCAPIEPSNAITPKASANVVAAVAAMRRLISEIRRRRASRRALAIAAGDRGVSGVGEVWDMTAKLGAPAEKTLEGACEVPEKRGRALAQPILRPASGCSQRPDRLSCRAPRGVLLRTRADVRTPCFPSERCFLLASSSGVPPR